MDTTVAGLDVRVRGTGDPVLLVHGSGGGAGSWDGVADLLSGGFEVWSFVRRGYGGGQCPSTFAAEVPDVCALLDAIGRPAHVVGASLGATLALHAAAADQRGVASLVLFEPPLLLPGPHVPGLRVRHDGLVAAGAYREADLLLARELMHAPAPLVEMIAAAPAPDPAEAAREARGWSGDLAQLAAEPTDTDRFSTITRPVLLLQGADTWSPVPEGVDALARSLPRAERVVWPGQSHFAVATAPGLFAAAVADWVRAHAMSRRRR